MPRIKKRKPTLYHRTKHINSCGLHNGTRRDKIKRAEARRRLKRNILSEVREEVLNDCMDIFNDIQMEKESLQQNM